MSSTHPASLPDRPHVNDEMLTMREVADLLRVPEATLRYWRHLGTGPRGFRVGRSVRYWRTEVASWLEERSHSTEASLSHSQCPRRERE